MELTWWGHSTATVTDGGITVVTDPVLTDRIAHLRRRAGDSPPASVAAADDVLVSHLHADHLDVSSLRRLDPSATLVAPHGARGVLRHRAPALARRCLEVAPGDTVELGHVRVTATPAQHPGARGPWSRHTGQALGYLIDGGPPQSRVRTYFAGDTGLGAFLDDLTGIDAALLPVGGWGPTLGPEHLDPVRAVEATRRLQPRLVVPIHYGTFWPVGLGWLRPNLFARPGPEYARLVRAAGLDVEVEVLHQGGSVEIAASRRSATQSDIGGR